MPLIEADATGLEVVGAAYLSQCPVLMQEIRDGIDIHGENQKALGFPEGPEGRLKAKIFKFRLIYGGNEYSYALDPDFNTVSKRPQYWKKIIDDYYNKYRGMALWHKELMLGVMKTGKYTTPTGRVFLFEMVKNRGLAEYPRTTILNYPVQSLGADIMSVIRVSSAKRLSKVPNTLLVNTVHDSILVDTKKGNEDIICKTFHEVFNDFPRNFKKVFGSDFNLPLTCKIKAGSNWKEMKEL